MTGNIHWLAMTASSLLATLMLVTGAEASDTLSSTANSATPTLASPNAPQLIAARKKKRIKKRRARVRVKPQPTATTTTPSDVSQTPPPPPAPTEVSPPPAPSVTTEEVEALRKANQELKEELDKVNGRVGETDKKVEQIEKQQFSITTKLQGTVVFGATGTISGDYSRNTAFGHRTRLELLTDVGGGTLTTRLQAVGFGLSNQNPTANNAVATNEGSLSWTDGTTTSTVGIDALKYEFPLSPQTQVVAIANAGAADDFTDTINPYFDGDGNRGAISSFANRPSIYYTIQGAGLGVRHKLSEGAELSLGYLARNANNPALGNGLLGGGYGALAQLSFKTGENSKIGLTYTRSLDSDFGTGSTNANQGGASDNFGLQGSFQVAPQFVLGGWAGYSQNQAPAGGGDRQIWNWAVTVAAPDLGGKGNLAGVLVGQEPRVTSSANGTTDTKAGLHVEGFYQFKVNDNLSITPGIIYLSAPNQDANSNPAVIGAIRSTFSF